MTRSIPESPLATFVRRLVIVDGWLFVGVWQDPPEPPEGFEIETREDGFFGIVTHYRFVPTQAKS